MQNCKFSTTDRIKISLSNIRLPWLIFTLVIFAGLIQLGLWQSSRALEKEQRLERIVNLKEQNSLSLPKVLALQKLNTQANYTNDFPVTVDGTFLPNT
ncbi:MAG: surfeit locus 1 family protein, partial [Enterobacterales bacterium]